jgi:predicted helicase
MYAQTIAYGLFAARCETDKGKDFTRQQAAYLIPKTNPFLRKLFNYIAGPELDESITWAVDDLAQILAWADMEVVLKDFGKSTGKTDPVVHFYETFLKEYDPKTREMRGVYYTPLPVVSYIVRSIDHILKTSFEKPQGLADPSVLVLDPAVGTATFLYMVMQEIHDAVIKQGQSGTWDNYVTEKLLPRLFGFELLMAPYAIAHLKLGRLLKETGYQFQTDQRLGIYLTNTLEEAVKHSDTMFAQWITEEANAAAEIKKTKPIMVVLGNPPYSGASANKGKWAKELVQRYYQVDGAPLGERNPKWLQDDYVKFLAFGQWRIEKTGAGVLAFITNHGYLDSTTFRGMRQSLMNTFTDIYILNLHGNAKKKEVAPDGSKDENVFDIQQGVSIGIFIKEMGKISPAMVHYADLWGKREGKYEVLAVTDFTSTTWIELKPTSPHYLFVPQDTELLPEYEQGWKTTDIFPTNSVGIVTSRDDFVFDFDEEKLKNRINTFLDTELSDDKVKESLKLEDKKGWTVADARKAISQDKDWGKAFTKCLYRPFDVKPLFYHKVVIERSRPEVMRHMLAGKNLGLIARRQMIGELMSYFYVSKYMISDGVIRSDNKGGESLFPLWLYPADGEMQLGEKRHPNLNNDFIKVLSEKLGLTFVEDGKGNLRETFGPEDIFNYAYAVFHSPAYRSRYAEFLKTDFPRLPLTSDKGLFKSLAEKGAVLVALHLMESPLLNNLITKYEVKGEHLVDKVGYDEKSQRVSINKNQYFEGVPKEVWNFYIGGYQVCEKWLKDRKSRVLSIDDINHYQKIVVAINETIRLMNEIDSLITKWPIE